jgi:hypothetical protein
MASKPGYSMSGGVGGTGNVGAGRVNHPDGKTPNQKPDTDWTSKQIIPGVSPKRTEQIDEYNAAEKAKRDKAAAMAKAIVAAREKAKNIALSEAARSAKKPSDYNPMRGSSDVSEKGRLAAAIKRAKMAGQRNAGKGK